MIRSVNTLDDARISIRELDSRLNKLETGNQDFHRRRIVNAHPSVDDYDYVVRKELLQPVQNIVSINPPGGTGSGGGGGGSNKNFDIRTFGFAIGRDLETGSDLLPPLIIPWTDCKLEKIYAKCKVPPNGSDAIADINSVSVSIIGSPFIVIPEGSFSVITISSFAQENFHEGEVLTFDLDQAGSTDAGQTLVITLKFRIINV